MNELVDLLHERLPLDVALARLVVVVALFAAAWALAAVAIRGAGWLVERGERRGTRLRRRKERETAISIVQTSIRYGVWTVALLLAFVTAVGARGISTVVGASFLAIVLGFAAQRFLIDLVAGATMFFEGWLRIGDSVTIEPWDVEGVVEEVSLRAVAVRGAGGELMRVHNSQVLAVRQYPRGHREAEIDLVVRDLGRGRDLIEELGPLLPVEPTRFVRAPELVEERRLGDSLVGLRLKVAVVPGREWLAESLLPSLLRELAGEDLIVHGPVVSFVDEVAQRRFGRLALVGARNGERSRAA